MSSILVTGAKGQLGSDLQAISKRYPDNDFIFTDVDELNILNPELLDFFFDKYKITHCINCAAFTAVDLAESESEQARRINVEGPELIAKACRKHNSALIHISTDFVFDGKKRDPYLEDDDPSPLGVYGKTKYEGEKKVLEHHDGSIIVRASWLYSAYGSNFVKTMIRLGNEKDEISVVNDQVGSPTYARDLATAIMVVTGRLDKGKSELSGIYHYSNQGVTSWYDFAKEVIRLMEISCEVIPIATAEYPTPAERPGYSVLDSSKIKRTFNVEIRPWQDSLKDCLGVIRNEEAK